MKPNILFVHYDSMRASALSCYGNPFVETPNHDRLAARGVVFDNCIAQNPVCSPSRCSMVTGHYPHTFGHRTLWQLLQPEEPSLFASLERNGYRVVNYGDKNDLYSQASLDLIYDNVEELRDGFTPRTPFRADWRARNPYPLEDPRYYSFLLDPIPDDPAKPPDLHRSYAGAVDFIEDWSPGDRPFVLYVPTSPPHPPYTCLERFYRMYDPRSLRDYVTPPEVVRGAPEYVRFYQEHYGTREYGEEYPSTICAVYHGMVSYMDWVLGRLMDALERRGLLESTIVVVTSDHGDWAGNRALFEKHHDAFDDDMLRVPLIVSAPGVRRGLTVKGQVELFDILPTLLELTGTSHEQEHFAVSLLPELRGERDDASRPAFAEGGYNALEYERNRQANTRDGVMVPENPYYRMITVSRQHENVMCRGVCVRTPEHKLVRRQNGEHELYDLRRDPRETRNLYGEPGLQEVVRRLEEVLLDWFIRTGDAAPAGRDPRGFGPRKRQP